MFDASPTTHHQRWMLAPLSAAPVGVGDVTLTNSGGDPSSVNGGTPIDPDLGNDPTVFPNPEDPNDPNNQNGVDPSMTPTNNTPAPSYTPTPYNPSPSPSPSPSTTPAATTTSSSSSTTPLIIGGLVLAVGIGAIALIAHQKSVAAASPSSSARRTATRRRR